MRRENRRSGRRGPIALPEMNLTPLIDTVLVLLVVFMVTSPMLQQGINVNVKLPEGKTQEIKETKQEFVVSIDKDAKLFFNNESVATFNDLIDIVKKKTTGADDVTVFVKADTSVNYGKVMEVVDRIKYVGGVKYVALATKRLA